MRAWASAAVSLGFLSKSGNRLLLEKDMEKILLDATSEEFLAGQFSYLALRSLDYAHMDSLFLFGKPRSPTSSFEAIDSATQWDHNSFIKNLQKDRKANQLLVKGCSFLDVGCGTGGLVKRLASLYPNSQFQGIDPSKSAIVEARSKVSSRGVRFAVMSAEEMKYSEQFDIVFMGEVLYSISSKLKATRLCHRALRPGGKIAIVEGLLPLPHSSNAEEDRLILGMQIDYALQGKSFLSRHGIESLLLKAGFKSPKFTDLGGRLFLITGQK